MEVTMRICTDVSQLAFTAGQSASLHDAQGTRIECLSGSLWITQEDEGRDIVLAPGEAFTLGRNGKTVVHAFKPSLALVIESRPVAPGTPWWTRLAYALLCHFMELGMRRSAWRRAYRI
jgi:hypothetical protein